MLEARPCVAGLRRTTRSDCRRAATHGAPSYITALPHCRINTLTPYFCPMNIIPLSEGSFSIDGTKRFVPFDTDRDSLTNRPAGSILVEIQPFVVVTNKDIILLDTGLGFHNADGNLQIHQHLLDHDINPLDLKTNCSGIIM
jgi:hypothetical protein